MEPAAAPPDVEPLERRLRRSERRLGCVSAYLLVAVQVLLLSLVLDPGPSPGTGAYLTSALVAGAVLGAWGARVLLFGAAGYAAVVLGVPALFAGMSVSEGVVPPARWSPWLGALGWFAANEALLLAAGGGVLALRARWRRRGPHGEADLP